MIFLQTFPRACDSRKKKYLHLSLGSWLRRSRGSRGEEKLTVLGRVRRVDQQPSRQPEGRGTDGDAEDKAELSIVSGPEQVEGGVDNETRSGNEEEVSHVSGEDTPHDDGESKESKVNSSKD